MGITYSDVIEFTFGDREFTTDDVRRFTGHPDPAKLLSNLKMKGVVVRMGRGRYKCPSPRTTWDFREAEWERVRSVILRAPMGKIISHSWAVEVWTDGNYRLSDNLFHRVFDISIAAEDYGKWLRYLKTHGIPTVGKKKIGSVVRIHPVKEFDYTLINGMPVLTKSEVFRLIEEHPGLYAGARDLIEH